MRLGRLLDVREQGVQIAQPEPMVRAAMRALETPPNDGRMRRDTRVRRNRYFASGFDASRRE